MNTDFNDEKCKEIIFSKSSDAQPGLRSYSNVIKENEIVLIGSGRFYQNSWKQKSQKTIRFQTNDSRKNFSYNII